MIYSQAVDHKYEEELRVMDMNRKPCICDYPKNDILSRVITIQE